MLYPGEKIRTARILLMPWDGEVDDAFNLSRRFLLKYGLVASARGIGGDEVETYNKIKPYIDVVYSLIVICFACTVGYDTYKFIKTKVKEKNENEEN